MADDARTSSPGSTRSRARPRLLAVLLGLAVAVFVPATTLHASALVATGNPHPYYVALGDSLSRGDQPNGAGKTKNTQHGYVDDLYKFYHQQVPGLLLDKLGCPGESTTTMIHGGLCSYSLGSQLNQAVAFVTTHDVAFMTIDIGANNVDGCIKGTSIDGNCVIAGITTASQELPVILGTLRAAAPTVPIFAMNYYDPFLALWLLGPSEHALAQATAGIGHSYNNILGAVYAAFSVPVADVETAFHGLDQTNVPALNLPLNVATVCAWTWMCAPAPRGPNIHLNATGYAVVAATFETTIGTI